MTDFLALALQASVFEENLKIIARRVCDRLFKDVEKNIFVPIRHFEKKNGEGSLPDVLERATISIIAAFVYHAVHPLARKEFLAQVQIAVDQTAALDIQIQTMDAMQRGKKPS